MATNTQTIVIQCVDLTEYNNAITKINAWAGIPTVNSVTQDQTNLKLTIVMNSEQVSV